MPVYTFQRQDGELFDKRLSFAEFTADKAGDQRVVDEEGQTMTLVFNPAGLGFVMKDGISGGWISKSLKENDYRSKRREHLAKREKQHFHTATLVPNYEGQEAHSWAEVRDHVRSVKGEASAKTYDRLVTQERGSPT